MIASQVGSVKVDADQAKKILQIYQEIARRYLLRREQLEHRLAHYQQQLTLAEEGLRDSIQQTVAAVRVDSSALGHVNLTVFDTLHRLLNDIELVAMDQPADPLPPLERPTPDEDEPVVSFSETESTS